ncbi:MAG TPA: DNA polymerase I [Bdellovibrionales bacterium]|nr:MAG: DNA polymerase I [Bdellovibrionales bacterium GWB1_52_6]OFZ04165.1 MAG: DNA polymerase I [Bdellovibrionales bacterium GWA1_52_35]OFZ33282.1 MAG: DNA polymerase I [Bdellovibrionales bacterium GWC1_52_8]HAR41760.1 DNA polymerase I [Bdellovibrionales bacterium]HCM40508.1 DNA polymerase I [Bdellovibrionales bacterium]
MPFLDPSNTLYLIDVSSFIFRAFFGIRPLHTKTGEPTNAVYGVATMLARLVEEAKPELLAVVYDSKEPSFRKTLYTEYKANRSAPPEELVPQFARIEELVRAMEIPSYRLSGVEADDLIATLVRKWCAESPDHKAVVVTGDKDLMQLVGPCVKIWDTMANKFYGPEQVVEKFGVNPEQIRDYLALVGDSSDNIPGVPSIGPKTAADLLREYGTLTLILEAAKNSKIPGKKGEAIRTHEANAKLSAELATVHESLDVVPDKKLLSYHFHVTEHLGTLFAELNFNSLLERWHIKVAENAKLAGGGHIERTASPADLSAQVTGAASGAATRPRPAVPVADQPVSPAVLAPLAPGKFTTVNTDEALAALLKKMERTKEFGFDLETTSLNPREAEIVGFSICCEPSESFYIPVGHRATSETQLEFTKVLAALKPYLENPRYKKIGQNLKYDWSILLAQGLKPDGLGADTMIAAYVLNAEGRLNLAALADKYLNYKVLTYEEVCGKGKDALCFDLVPISLATRYAAEDAWVALILWHKLRDKLKDEHLLEVFARIDMPLVSVLAGMESEGVCIDVPWLQTTSREFGIELRELETRVQAFTHGPLNLNSPKQLAHLLFDELKLPVQSKTKTGYSTDASVLEILAPLHEVPRILLEYREISKLKGTYVDPLPGLRDPKTGRIHASFNQTVTATGRLSSSDPNLQNIPVRTERGQKIRRAFIPSEGCVLIAVDYSQIELRILAHMSGDRELVASFKKGEDVHRRTASEIFGIAPESVNDRQRGIAKAINFGLMYGKTVFGLSQELGIPRHEAKDMIEKYFTRYAGVKRFLDQLILNARECGYSMTLLGRKRVLPDLQSRNPAIRNNAERMAMNTPIQGTAADLMKLAMIDLEDQLTKQNFRARMIIQVHDEIVLDCPKDEAPAVLKLVTEVMESALTLDVPLKVNAAQGANWMEL